MTFGSRQPCKLCFQGDGQMGPLIMQRQDFLMQSTLLHGVVGCIRGVLTMGQLLMVLQQVQATYIHSLIYLHSLSWINPEFA